MILYATQKVVGGTLIVLVVSVGPMTLIIQEFVKGLSNQIVPVGGLSYVMVQHLLLLLALPTLIVMVGTVAILFVLVVLFILVV